MATKPTMNMPEILVFAKPLVIGFIVAEIWRVAFYLGANFAPILSDVPPLIMTGGILFIVLLCLTYGYKRGAHTSTIRVSKSFRLDLLLAIGMGIWINVMVSPWLAKPHEALKNADPYWAPAILLLLCTMLISPLIQDFRARSKKTPRHQYFISDEAIGNKSEDLLASKTQAELFAKTVLDSGTHPGLIFGVDGPWGVGKTSFINLAEHFWREAEDKVIVCRFEPLRYASEPDLTDRLIRDLSSSIQRKVFAPEFRPAASRYSRLIKGKADFSFLGFKLSLQPTQETVDELLDDIDEVLKRIGRRVIIVIDDLDRLDAIAVNNVLFATRQTFNLSQATYILCYDTEELVGSQGVRARDFLEKFVTVKLSLFVDSSSIRDFLRKDWQKKENQLSTIPSDTIVKLSEILNELADIMDGALAAEYLPLVGNMRKLKRFVNAMLLMQIEKSALGQTDFSKQDLINLMLLHLHYPGLFRRIYAEETQGRCGVFSVRQDYEARSFKNHEELTELIAEQTKTAGFLLKQLFDVKTLNLGNSSSINEEVTSSRACFNRTNLRNLDKYLNLIVRFVTPMPQDTFALYQKAVEKVSNGSSIESILSSSDFNLGHGEYVHDEFWRVLVNNSQNFSHGAAEDAIDSLVKHLPLYSMIDLYDRGLRNRSIYSLLILLDRSGWGRKLGRRPQNTPENIVEIAQRIFGEGLFKGKGLIHRLATSDRGVLGWHDLMMFRLHCSADRQGQLYNLQSALIIDIDSHAKTTGLVSELSLMGMRKLSQEVFALFKKTYIDPKHNFFTEADNVPDNIFLGENGTLREQASSNEDQTGKNSISLGQRISMTRSGIKTFVIYQLSNSLPPHGSGVGCGYYDESGSTDRGIIAKLMNDYVFKVCFSPKFDENNIFHFLDYCLSNLSHSFFIGEGDKGYIATKNSLAGGLDPKEMGQYWNANKEQILKQSLQNEDRLVVTLNYIASYSEDLEGVFNVLDELAKEETSDVT
ncbi:KAP family NTPase [Vreelandella neptunia]|uniref:KAP family NTPase n=1 Tax=Vreelandella neptunia TaxID=115551 RepID=A0ABS9S8A7_9GAMM|nr:KAP family NTPase [Halomonas neptunia]MCH4812346.1 KAP family NTPase [Halomonas neptunia]